MSAFAGKTPRAQQPVLTPKLAKHAIKGVITKMFIGGQDGLLCWRRSSLLIIRLFLRHELKDIEHVRIRAGKQNAAITHTRRLSAIANDVDIRKGDMHGQGTEFAALTRVIKTIANLMPTMAGTGTTTLTQDDGDVLFLHDYPWKTTKGNGSQPLAPHVQKS
jgi:hypothetical protein